MSLSCSFDSGFGLGEAFGFGSPFTFRFVGTRFCGGGTGAREDCLEESLDMGSIGLGIDCLDCFRGFDVGVGLGFGDGSALERIDEKAIGSAGLLGVLAGGRGSCFTTGPTPLYCTAGEVIEAILGEFAIDDGGGCACDVPKFEVTGVV